MRGGALLMLSAALAQGADWVSLFNGKDLSGWTGSKRHWRVENGVIVGTTDEHPTELNTFLIYEKKPFADFHLSAEVKIRNGNSGIQFRSTYLPGPGFIVYGTQADAADETKSWGNFYEERGRGRGVMKTPDEGWRRAEPVVKKGDWNRIEVIARGPAVKLVLNGTATWEGSDGKKLDGILALQLHAGKPMRVEFREIRIKELP
ncbi:MAG: DUF1080 domain-containing protein [Acidobacteria bacterium]|nr:DUF1080 domain-containing protein [Acidobacteriota bacterium]